MPNTIWLWLTALGGAGVAFFTAQWLQYRKQYRSMSRIERREADYAAESGAKRTPRQRLLTALAKRGYRGDATSALILLGFLYVLCALIAHVLGINGLVAVAFAVPLSVGAASVILGTLAARRRRAFGRQLMQMLNLLAAQIESGVGSRRALDIVAPNVADPARGEFTAVLTSVAAGKDIVVGLRELSERYPSRAMSMVIAAFEIDRDQGGRIAPALRQAANILQRDFDLAAEAEAELSQSKGEFFGIVAVITMIALTMFQGGGDAARSAYLSPLGMAVCGVALANAALGIFRALRLFSRSRGDL